MRTRFVILSKPRIHVGLESVKAVIDLLAKGNPRELIEDGLVKPLGDAIGLRAFDLGAGMVNVLDR